jgi:hypothetical protein
MSPPKPPRFSTIINRQTTVPPSPPPNKQLNGAGIYLTRQGNQPLIQSPPLTRPISRALIR